MSEISIIMPVYNRESFLDKSVLSLMNQTFKDIEILLIDDGSTDNSLKKLNEFAELDTRIKVFHQENKGPATARNLGLDNATGKYIMFCDSDDAYTPEMCEIMYQTIEKEKTDLVMCNALDQNNMSIRIYKKHITRNDLLDNIFLWNKIFKKSIIDKYNIRFPDGYYISEDNLFIWTYSSVTKKYTNINDNLYKYKYDTDNSTSQQLKAPWFLKNRMYVMKELKNFFLKQHIPIKGKREKFFIQVVKRELQYLTVPCQNHKDEITSFIKEIFSDSLKYQKYFIDFVNKINVDIIQKYPFKLNDDDVNIVFNCDNTYITALLVTLESLLKHRNKNKKYNIFILCKNCLQLGFVGIEQLLMKYKDVNVYLYDIKELYDKYFKEIQYVKVKYISITAIYRLFISKLFTGSKILYLDCDLVIRQDISKLYNIDLNNKAIAVVKDFVFSNLTFDEFFKYHPNIEEKNLINKTTDYFNSGVLLINLKRYENYFENFIKKIDFKKHLLDQDILNTTVPSNDILYLPTEWNYQIGSLTDVKRYNKKAYNQIKKNKKYIVHYTNWIKPWVINVKPFNIHNIYWWKYGYKYLNNLIQIFKYLVEKPWVIIANDDIKKTIPEIKENDDIVIKSEPKAYDIKSKKDYINLSFKTDELKCIFIILTNTSDLNFIYYDKLMINNKVIFDKMTPVSSKLKYEYSIFIKKGENVNLYLSSKDYRKIFILKKWFCILKRFIKQPFEVKNDLHILISNRRTIENRIEFINGENVCYIEYPEWFKGNDGNGAFVVSQRKYSLVNVNCINKGIFNLLLSSPKPKKWEYITKVKINDVVVFKGIKPVSYDKRFKLKYTVNDNQKVKIEVFRKRFSIIGYIKSMF